MFLSILSQDLTIEKKLIQGFTINGLLQSELNNSHTTYVELNVSKSAGDVWGDIKMLPVTSYPFWKLKSDFQIWTSQHHRTPMLSGPSDISRNQLPASPPNLLFRTSTSLHSHSLVPYHIIFIPSSQHFVKSSATDMSTPHDSHFQQPAEGYFPIISNEYFDDLDTTSPSIPQWWFSLPGPWQDFPPETLANLPPVAPEDLLPPPESTLPTIYESGAFGYCHTCGYNLNDDWGHVDDFNLVNDFGLVVDGSSYVNHYNQGHWDTPFGYLVEQAGQPGWDSEYIPTGDVNLGFGEDERTVAGAETESLKASKVIAGTTIESADQANALQVRRDSLELARGRVKKPVTNSQTSNTVSKPKKSLLKSFFNKLFGRSKSWPEEQQSEKQNINSVKLILRCDDAGLLSETVIPIHLPKNMKRLKIKTTACHDKGVLDHTYSWSREEDSEA
jgi:hypothetical protein